MVEQTIPFLAARSAAFQTERRVWIRSPSKHDIRGQPDEENTAWLGRVQGISRGGITLILGQPVKLGTVLNVELETKADRPRRPVVQVVHATRHTGMDWLIGCAFAWPLSEGELQDFLKE